MSPQEKLPQAIDQPGSHPEGSLIHEMGRLQSGVNAAMAQHTEARRDESLLRTRGSYDYANMVAFPLLSLASAVRVARTGRKENKAKQKLNRQVAKISELQGQALNDARDKGVEVTGWEEHEVE